MKFVDLNTFYGPKAGGIRTYHHAKMAWFAQHPEHEYALVFPGVQDHEEWVHPNVRLVQLRGPAVTRDPQGYRLLLDIPRVYRWLRREAPEVIESGDPWLTGPMTLLMHRLGRFKGVLSHFYHSDPIPSYVVPWARKPGLQGLKRTLTRLAGRLFYALQALYPVTVASSRVMANSLQAQGVRKTAFMPFGVHPAFFAAGKARAQSQASAVSSPTSASGSQPGRLRLLYAGRLDAEKGWDVLMPCLTELLKDGGFSLTVAGRGRYAETLAALRHEHYRFAGFVAGAEGMAALYRDADVLLAPGPYETFGLGVLEAMAAGLPVIGPDAGGAGELLAEAKSPLRFKAGDRDAFMRALHMAHGCDRAAVAAAQNEVARAYGTWDEAMSRLMRFYADCVDQGRRF